MKYIAFFVIVAIVYVLFFIHENYRKPIYIYNTWQENDQDTTIARAIIIIMCILSFIGGLLH
jgi:hypothetical protein